MAYETITVKTPPTIAEIDGEWFICIHDGTNTYQAPVGHWFAAQFIARVILPELVLKAGTEKPPILHKVTHVD